MPLVTLMVRRLMLLRCSGIEPLRSKNSCCHLKTVALVVKPLKGKEDPISQLFMVTAPVVGLAVETRPWARYSVPPIFSWTINSSSKKRWGSLEVVPKLVSSRLKLVAVTPMPLASGLALKSMTTWWVRKP